MAEKFDPIHGYRSVSQLQNYVDRCAYGYYLEKIVRVPRRTATWFIQGTAVHSAAEQYERSYRTLTTEQCQTIFEAAWIADMAEAESKQPDHKMWMVGGKKSRQEDIERRYDLGLSQVADYVRLNTPEDDWLPTEFAPGEPATEVKFDLDLNGVRVVGFIDVVLENRKTGALRVRDIKTGNKVPSDPFQMATYKVAIEEATGVEVNEGVWWMCKDAKDSRPFKMKHYTRPIVAKWYAQMDNGVKAGIFPPRPGDCFTCTVRPYCEHDNPNPIPLPEPAVVIPPGLDVS